MEFNSISDITSYIKRKDLIEYLDVNFDFSKKLYSLIISNKLNSRSEINDYIIQNKLFESKLARFKFIIKSKLTFLLNNSRAVSIKVINEYVPPKKEPKVEKKGMSQEEISAVIGKYSRPSIPRYYSSSFSDIEDSFDEYICPICGSTDFVGGYCDDCGWIE